MLQTDSKEQFDLIKAGDERAYEAAFKLYYQKLCNFAFNFIEDMDEAEEAVQQVFLNLWEKKSRIQITTSLQSYLYGAVKNECLNKLKHNKVRLAYREGAGDITDYTTDRSHQDIISLELEKEIYAAVESLPAQCKLIFQMSRYEEMKYSEIAEGLSISIKTVENQIGKALRTMRIRLADFLPLLVIFSYLIN